MNAIGWNEWKNRRILCRKKNRTYIKIFLEMFKFFFFFSAVAALWFHGYRCHFVMSFTHFCIRSLLSAFNNGIFIRLVLVIYLHSISAAKRSQYTKCCERALYFSKKRPPKHLIRQTQIVFYYEWLAIECFTFSIYDTLDLEAIFVKPARAHSKPNWNATMLNR